MMSEAVAVPESSSSGRFGWGGGFWGRAWSFLKSRSLFVPALFLVAGTLLLVSPRGDFALNDDWVYAKAVQSFLDTGRFQQHPYAASIAVGMQLYGSVWAKAFGFSYTVLRLSTLSCLVLCLWAIARCAVAMGMSRATALVCSGLVVCNPIVINLSYTFMTDVPFMTAAGLATLFALRALKGGRARDYALAGLFCVLASFIRQFGVILAIAFVIALAARWRRTGERVSARALASGVVPFVVGAALLLVYVRTQTNAIAPGGGSSVWTVGAWFSKTPQYVGIAALYGGLFTLPVFFSRAGLLIARRETWGWGRWVVFGAFCAMVQALACPTWGHRLPLLPNILRDLGAGPLTFRDVYFWNPGWSPVWIGEWWRPITWLSALAAGLVLTDMAWQGASALRRGLVGVNPKKRGRKRDVGKAGIDAASPLPDQRLFLILVVMGMTLAQFNPVWPTILDRYLLTMLAPLALIVCQGLRGRASHAVAAAGCFLVYLFSVAALQDYMAWNHAKWGAIEELLHVRKVDPFRIDGGYEYNGMYTSDAFRELAKSNAQGPMGQYLFDDTYALSFQAREDYEEIGRAPYFSWLDMQSHALLVLRRTKPSPHSLLPPLSGAP